MKEVRADDNSPGGEVTDAYRQWLGVGTVERPPSPYALFGLSELEADVSAIGDAAISAKRTLRSYQIGKYRNQAIQLQAEVSRAADILTHPEKKAAYDAQRTEILLERAQANFPQADLGRPLDDLFVDWLTACDRVGMPVPQLLPRLMTWCLGRSFNWPQRGLIKAPLPLGLWVYLEAALVGQLVERNTVEMRVRAVKAIQQSLGVSENLARMVNQHIGRRPKSFALLPVVQQAANEPRELMQEWVDRLAAHGVTIDMQSACYRAMAFLLGLRSQDGEALDKPVEPRIKVPQRRSAVLRAGRQCREICDRVVTRWRMFSADHPDMASAIKLAAMIALGLFVLIVVLLIVAGGP